jgi:light-regulated signal transduction histidine kinase (bacteriophytochrome)
MSDLLRSEPAVDLTNCDREPIHVPGAVQPYGVLLGVEEPSLRVVQVSENCRDLLGRDPDDVLGRRLGDAVPGELAAALEEAARTPGDPAEHYPLSSSVALDGRALHVDALLHRSDGLLVVEVEPGAGPVTFDRAYRATRTAVSRINRAAEPTDLFAIAAQEVRRLTGFDRVMIYRFDPDWNGEVVAEDRADRLNSFLGLRYPATDIPAQARELYRRNWLRLIPDVGYRPAVLRPVENPLTGRPLDLSHSTLRSVSPIHVEYLQNMGVTASMSISLLDAGELWGLIACHHYTGPHRPPYEVRAASEFLGQALSLRLVAATNAEELRRAVAARSRLATLSAEVAGGVRAAAAVLTQGRPNLLDLVDASGAATLIDGVYGEVGDVPDERVVRRLVARLGGDHADAAEDVQSVESVPFVVPELADHKDRLCGALLLRLSPDQFVMWTRPEQVRTVDWGGDPQNKAIAAQEGDTVRLSPRKSFERWRETVRLRSRPWTAGDVETAAQLRHNLLEALYGRARRMASVAETLQRSLLPDHLPRVPGWTLCADYATSVGGEVGGDWYDVVPLPSGRFACVLGDVAGHGITAAGTMGQLRNGLRAYLVEDDSPAVVLQRMSRLAEQLLPLALATATLVVVDPRTGRATVASAGHPPVCHVRAAGTAAVLDVTPWPPLGAAAGLPRPAVETTIDLAPGEALLLYSDGLVERRDEEIDVGLARLERLAAGAGDATELCDRLMEQCRDPAGSDDATILVVGRNP